MNFFLTGLLLKEHNLCTHCDNCIDDIVHYFVQCKTVINFWTEVFNWWQKISETVIHVEICEILFGILNPNEDTTMNVLNVILTTAKWFIYQCKKGENNIFFVNYLVYLRHTFEVEKYIEYKNGNKTEFDYKWTLLCDLFNEDIAGI